MKNQLVNPYLPGYEYIPDAEPRLFGDRVYIYGSHDAFGGEDYCVNDYVCWSAPAEDLSDWRYEGVIFTRSQDPQSPRGERKMQAPDVVQGPDGRYYMYYTLDLRGEVGPTSVAVCDTPAGRYEYAGMVSWPDGHALGSWEGELLTFDPGVLVDDDGRVYLFTGIAVPDIPPLRAKVAAKKRVADGCYLVELDRDMMTVVGQPKRVLIGFDEAAGTPFEGHAFFETSSPRKIDGRYYLFYCSQRSHELCYALSERVDGPYRCGGTVVSIGDVGLEGRTEATAVNYLGNTHGGLLTVNGRHYISYHRQTNLIQYARQGCMEPVTILPDGTIPQVRITSSGLRDGPLPGQGSYEARIACCLRSREGVFAYKVFPTPPGVHPYLTQDTPDHMGRSDQYVANLQDGAYAGFRSFDMHGPARIGVVVRGSGEGALVVSTEPEGEALAEIPVQPCGFWHALSAAMEPVEGVHDLFFTFHGTGAVDFFSFTLT